MSANPSSSISASTPSNAFLSNTTEKIKMNQYWYSSSTINSIVKEIELNSKRCAFLSTPSLFFSLTNSTLQSQSTLFDYDTEQFGSNPRFCFYDFKKLHETIGKEHHHQYDFVVVDPPFITEDVWKLYAKAIQLLLIEGMEEAAAVTNSISISDPSTSTSASSLAPTDPTPSLPVPRGKFLVSTIPENLALLSSLLPHTRLCRFRPSIPNLIYQYSLFVNYQAASLEQFNPEIDQDEIEKEERKRKKQETSKAAAAVTSDLSANLTSSLPTASGKPASSASYSSSSVASSSNSSSSSGFGSLLASLAGSKEQNSSNANNGEAVNGLNGVDNYHSSRKKTTMESYSSEQAAADEAAAMASSSSS